MTPIPTSQLDAGDDSPKLARGSLLLAVTAVNQLFSVVELDLEPASMLVARPLKVTGGVGALSNTPRNVSAGSAVYAGVDPQSHADLSLVDSTGAANNKAARLYTTANGSLNLGFSNDDFSSTAAFLKADRTLNVTNLLTLTAATVSIVGAATVSGTLVASSFSGSGAGLTGLNASQLTTGSVAQARLGSGTADATTFLRGDGTWQVPPGAGLYVLKSGDSMSGALTIGNTSIFGGMLEISGSGTSAFASVQRYSSDVTPPGFAFVKTRGVSANAKTSVNTNDQLGVVSFQGTDGASVVIGAELRAVVSGTVSPGVIPTDVFLTTSNLERLRVTSAGFVGIGTSTPIGKLHVLSATGTNVLFQSTSTAVGDFTDLNLTANDMAGRLSTYGSQHNTRPSSYWLNMNGVGDVVIGTQNTERVRVSSQGRSTFTTAVASMVVFTTSVTSTAGTTSLDNAEIFSVNNSTISSANGAPFTDSRLFSFGGYSNGNAFVRNPSGGGLKFLVSTVQKLAVTNDLAQDTGTGNSLVQSTVIINTTASQSALFLQSGAAYAGFKIKAGPNTSGNGSTDYWDFTVRPGAGGVASQADQIAMRFENALNGTPSIYIQPTAGQVVVGASVAGISTAKLTVVAAGAGLQIQGNTTGGAGTSDLAITRTGASESYVAGLGANIQLTNGTNNSSVLIQQVANNLQIFNGVGNVWTERMRLAASGNLSIGTTTSNKLLTLGLDNATEGPVMVFRNNVMAAGSRPMGILFDAWRDVASPSYVAGIWAETSGTVGNFGSLIFGSQINGTAAFPTERMRLDTSGNLGIGKTPSVKLDVNGSIASSGDMLPGATYSNTVSTSGVAANTYLVAIPVSTLPLGAYHVTVRWDHVSSGVPYIVAVAFTMMVVNTNAAGDDIVFTAPVSTHRATDGANFNLRTYATSSGTTGLKVALNFAGGDGSFTVKAYRFA